MKKENLKRWGEESQTVNEGFFDIINLPWIDKKTELLRDL